MTFNGQWNHWHTFCALCSHICQYWCENVMCSFHGFVAWQSLSCCCSKSHPIYSPIAVSESSFFRAILSVLNENIPSLLLGSASAPHHCCSHISPGEQVACTAGALDSTCFAQLENKLHVPPALLTVTILHSRACTLPVELLPRTGHWLTLCCILGSKKKWELLLVL